MNKKNLTPRFAALISLTVVLSACSSDEPATSTEPAWATRNQRVIDANTITGRDRELPNLAIPNVLVPGEPALSAELPRVTLAPGVEAMLTWGRGALLERVEMQADAVYPARTLDEELIVIGIEGTATYELDGEAVELAADDVLYLEPGTTRSVAAGPNGWQVFEVYSPIPLDHLALAGQDVDDIDRGFPDQGVTPSLEPGVVVNINEIQWTPLTDPVAGLSYTRSGALSRLIWGRNAQVSWVRMDPGSEFPLHIHPEDQLTHTTRGNLVQGVMDTTYTATGDGGHTVFLPGNMVHSANLGDTGADQLDVFWPVRPDYMTRAAAQQALFSEVIAPGTRPQKLAEGFTFSEGPTWLNGKLYFSDMYFRDHKNGDWTGSPEMSRLIAMEPNGEWSVLSTGMQSNGTIATGDGTLIVCDMFGHRVVELDPETGEVLRVLLDEVNGMPIDGPNDLVMDAKGGLYITDPQFTPEAEKSQPGTQVYYLPPDGTARVVVGPGEFAMPNGVEISPDGRTAYINNTWDQPGENFVWAYDVADDGSFSNKRRFAMLNLTPDVLSAEDPSGRYASSADGTAVDTDGRYYVATSSGVQIFRPDGTFVGTIWAPQYPVSITFGGTDNSILYMVGESSVWSIETRVRGFRHPAVVN
jgi:gluconolactonase